MMERRFDMSDFEQSLKDHADQFILFPSKRVWNGIYNNLHPGSRWPSISVAIVLLSTLIILGNLNNSPKPPKNLKSGITFSKEDNSSATNNKASYLKHGIPLQKNMPLEQADYGISGRNSIAENNETSNNGTAGILRKNMENNNSINEKNKIGNKWSEMKANNNSKDYRIFPIKSTSGLAQNNKTEKFNNKNSDKNYFSNTSNINKELNYQEYEKLGNSNYIDELNNSLFQQRINANFNEDPSENILNIDNSNILEETSNSIRNELEIPVSNEISSFVTPIGFFAYNLEKNVDVDNGNTEVVVSKKGSPKSTNTAKKLRKKNNKIEWVYYVTPLISTATFRGKGITPMANNYFPIVIFQNPTSYGMIYNAKMGFETGAKMTYALSKKWKFLTGFNLNYSDYNIVSNLLHPTFATLMFNNEATGIPYSKSYVTFYGNGQSLNQVGLTNYSLQASIPVGLQYEIWGNKKIQINLASSIEPSLVLKSHSYIISADKRYYVSDPSLMQKMNISGNFGPVITFRSRKVKWHIGPEIHYQFLSTYKNYYPIREHSIDYGIRIGISK
ncbi:MAG TPA: hypothetical protein VMU83_02805 [Hanamia sp.]|nr:hypothetical protein [Hanamia sp.]